MLKITPSLKELEDQAAGALRALIAQVPAIRLEDVEVEARAGDRNVDILAHINVHDHPHMLVCEVKSNGQPRHVRAALLQLRNYAAHLGKDATPIFIAPYLSPEAQALCRENDVGFLDLEGNARVAFRNVFIERLVSNKPSSARRELKSLFKPKSAQVLRVMLRDPGRGWRVAELAENASVSLGHVSNVRTGLLDREWGQVSEKGLFICGPNALLDAWRDAYDPPAGNRISFYTTLHGSALEDTARQVLGAQSERRKAVFGSFSAAHWLAPYGRTGTQYFYADNAGLERLKERLKLSPSPKGENVVVTVPKDDGLFRDTVEPAPGAVCTSAVQTYLDLWAAGERGKEAAEHLRHARLSWPT
jgi:Transcriptional regulator, AbiEi antitoxin, Type IV TA system